MSASGQPPKDPIDRLTNAYERMLGRVHRMLDTAEHALFPDPLRTALNRARERSVELGELTREEADRIAGYLQRDVEDAAHFLLDTGEDLRTWLRFDIEQIEERVLHAFISVADKTKVELADLADRARSPMRYQQGEVTGPGTLVCVDCGAQLSFTEPREIPACPKCGGRSFQRSR